MRTPVTEVRATHDPEVSLASFPSIARFDSSILLALDAVTKSASTPTLAFRVLPSRPPKPVSLQFDGMAIAALIVTPAGRITQPGAVPLQADEIASAKVENWSANLTFSIFGDSMLEPAAPLKSPWLTVVPNRSPFVIWLVPVDGNAIALALKVAPMFWLAPVIVMRTVKQTDCWPLMRCEQIVHCHCDGAGVIWLLSATTVVNWPAEFIAPTTVVWKVEPFRSGSWLIPDWLTQTP